MDDDRAAADRIAPPPSPGDRSWLLKTTTVTTYPTSGGVYYAVQRVIPGGAETEGGAASLSTLSPVFYAYNAGTGVPGSGTYVIGDLIGGRWVFFWDA